MLTDWIPGLNKVLVLVLEGTAGELQKVYKIWKSIDGSIILDF